MDDEVLNEAQVLAYDLLQATTKEPNFTVAKLQKYAAHINNILRRLQGGQSIADLVRDWVADSTGVFTFAQMCAELGIKIRPERKAADMRRSG